MTDKSALRRHCLELRSRIPADAKEEKTREILRRLFSLKEYAEAELILSYVSAGEEISTRDIIENALSLGKKVAVPRVDSRDMEFRIISSLSELVPGKYGIPTSDGERVKEFGKCLCVTPALCADKNFYRLGYGGGFYDRFISQNSGVFYAVLCFDSFIFEEIPHNSFDMAADCIITEKRIERRCI